MRGKVWFLRCALGIVLITAGAQQCFGAGFAIWEGSARGTALGQADVGRADDPSALFYNPAGITQLPGLQVMAGGAAILLSTEINNPHFGSQTTNADWGFPPHFYVTYQCNERLYFGLGVFTPFGLSVEFPRNWFGAFNNYDAEVTSVTINPNVAFKITDQLSVAAGFEAMEFGLILRQLINPVAPFPLPPALAPSLGLDGNSWGYGYNLAAHYKPCELFALGISYRSQVKQSASLSTDLDTAGDRPVAHTDAATSVTLPDSIAFGLALYPTKYLSWEVGGVWTQWSKFNAITFDFAQPILGFPSVTGTKDWHDTWRFQTGVEYKVLPCLDLRAGYIYDEEAINSQYRRLFATVQQPPLLFLGSRFPLGQMVAGSLIHLRFGRRPGRYAFSVGRLRKSDFSERRECEHNSREPELQILGVCLQRLLIRGGLVS